jgi:hypothetical protein
MGNKITGNQIKKITEREGCRLIIDDTRNTKYIKNNAA